MGDFWNGKPKSKLDILVEGDSKEKIVEDRLTKMIEHIENDCGNDLNKLLAYKAVVKIDYDDEIGDLPWVLLSVLLSFSSLIISAFLASSSEDKPKIIYYILILMMSGSKPSTEL